MPPKRPRTEAPDDRPPWSVGEPGDPWYDDVWYDDDDDVPRSSGWRRRLAIVGAVLALAGMLGGVVGSLLTIIR